MSLRNVVSGSMICVSLVSAASLVAAQSSPPPPPPAPMRPAVMYSCMTMPADGPPMVDADVPHAVEMQAPGYGIRRYTDETPPTGWSLWRIIGRARRDGESERISHVVGWDGTRVVSGAQLFLAMGTTGPMGNPRTTPPSPWLLARRALATIFRRAEERPLGVRDNATVHERVRGRITDPFVRDGHLSFWVRTEPGMPYAHEVEVDLATGRVIAGNVY